MKIMIFDQGNPVAGQLLGKAIEVFGEEAECVTVRNCRHHNVAAETLFRAVGEEKPELLLIGATALGEETAPELGVKLHTGVAAHCVDITKGQDEKPVFMVPAFGGKVIGEILIPGAEPGRPAIATVKPGIFREPEKCSSSGLSSISGKDRIIDIDGLIDEGKLPQGEKKQGSFRLTGIRPVEKKGRDIGKAELVFCGGYGLGKEENWRKLELLAEKFGGAAGCTRPALDAGWGAEESAMIGTSGRTVRPVVYVGFGISGASHHMCGISDADVIISINSDKDAEVFAASDYKGVYNAEAVINALLEEEKA